MTAGQCNGIRTKEPVERYVSTGGNVVGPGHNGSMMSATAAKFPTDAVFSRQSGLRLGLRNPLASGWNWGAFFFSWLWMFNHGYPRRALLLLVLDLIPGAGLIARIHCGLAGNDIAFDGRRFESSEEYLAVQSAWRNYGLMLTLLATVFGTFAFSGTTSLPTIQRYAAPRNAWRVGPDKALTATLASIRRTSTGFAAGEAHIMHELSMVRIPGQTASAIHLRAAHATPTNYRVLAATMRTAPSRAATAHVAAAPVRPPVAIASVAASRRAAYDAVKAEAQAQLRRGEAAAVRRVSAPLVVAAGAPPAAATSIAQPAAAIARSTGNPCEDAIGAVNEAIATTSAHDKYDASVAALRFLNACHRPSVVLQAQALALESKAIAEHAQGTLAWQSDLDSSIAIGTRCALDLDGDGTHGSERCRATATVGAQLRTEWRRPILLGQI